MLGLPNFINGYFRPKAPQFTYSVTCQNTSFTAGTVASSSGACSSLNNPLNSIQWLFGEPTSGAANTSTLNNPTHSYSNPGTFTVNCIYYYNCSSDTIVLPANIPSTAPSLSVAGTFTICKKEKRVFTASGANSFSWVTSGNINANTNSISLTPTVNTTFTLTGVNQLGCQSVKVYTINVKDCTGINVQTNNFNFIMYPNPVKDLLNINTDEIIKVVVFDQTGSQQILKDLIAGENTLDLSFLPSGVYILMAANSRHYNYYKFVRINE